MSVGYRSIQWNPQKKKYDLVLAGVLIASIAVFVAVSLARRPGITIETLILRSTALAAFALLNAILCIGPLSRLDARFLPLLYNRRHLGVTAFLLALVHGALATFQFHALSDENPLVSVLTAYAVDYAPFAAGRINLAHFPFEPLGLAALCILFLLAATSHDFWLRNLGPSFWKALHILVLVAYSLLVAHVAFGALQSETHPVYLLLLGASLAVVLGLHIAAARKEARIDATRGPETGWVPVAAVAALEEGKGRTVHLGNERVALYVHEGNVFAISNVCRHQGGPLGEGRILDGCVTCPWHGWQYRPADGCSPPPFEERVETYRVRIVDGEVQVHPGALPPGTLQAGVPLEGSPKAPDAGELYVGYLDPAPPLLARHLRRAVVALFLAGPALFALLAAAQNPFPTGVFEFGRSREFDGVLHESPLPFLRVTHPDVPDGGTGLLLVGPGKHGLPEVARGQAGQRVRFRGSLIHRQGMTMVEIDPPSFQVLGPVEPGSDESRVVVHGPVSVVGELVDTKCYLGVMRPATGKVHRACAVRCLAGGVPPGLLVTDSESRTSVFLLVGPRGGPLAFDPQMAARRFAARGRLELHDGLSVLLVDDFAELASQGAGPGPLPEGPDSVRMVGGPWAPGSNTGRETGDSR